MTEKASKKTQIMPMSMYKTQVLNRGKGNKGKSLLQDDSAAKFLQNMVNEPRLIALHKGKKQGKSAEQFMELGYFYLKKGNYNKAIINFYVRNKTQTFPVWQESKLIIRNKNKYHDDLFIIVDKWLEISKKRYTEIKT